MTTTVEADSSGGSGPEIRLLDPASYTNGQPLDQLLYLQEHEPVRWHPEPDGGPGFWALTRYQDVKTVFGDPELYSSFPSDAIPDGTSQGDGVNYCMLTMTDPPKHTQRRRHLALELLPRSVRDVTGHVDAVVTEVLDAVCERGECDLVTDIAGKVAAWVTADMMGLPRVDMVEMYEVADRILNTKDLTSGDGLQAVTRLQEYSMQVWEDRRVNDRGDLVSRYANTVVGDREPDYGQFLLDFLLFFTAAGDTTRNAIGGGVQALFEHPAELARLRGDSELLESGVEEILRWTAPIAYIRRTATADTELSGQRIESGQKVVSFFGAANRDPRVFTEPLRFDVGRTPNPHLTFAFGPHFCLGSHLARLELRVLFRELMVRLPGLEPAGPTVWSRHGLEFAPIVVGPHSLPVRFTPTQRSGA